MSINHPSYAPSAAGCVEDDVHTAIAASVANGGQITQLQWSETAARLLTQECEWESESSYSYRGEDCDGNTWRVHLVGPEGAEQDDTADCDAEERDTQAEEMAREDI